MGPKKKKKKLYKARLYLYLYRVFIQKKKSTSNPFFLHSIIISMVSMSPRRSGRKKNVTPELVVVSDNDDFQAVVSDDLCVV